MHEQLANILKKEIGTLTQEEIELITDTSTNYKDNLDGDLWAEIVLRSIEEQINISNLQDALSLFKDAYEEFNNVNPQLFGAKAKILKRTCELCLEKNDQNSAHEKMKVYMYNALDQVRNKATNASMPYYSFRGFSKYSLDDIAGETISLAHPREFNDPLDTILMYWLESEIKKPELSDVHMRYRLLMKKVAEHIKIRCLIAGKGKDGAEVGVEDLNVLMWSHYANSHRGFCVKYEFDQQLFTSGLHGSDGKIQFIDKINYMPKIELNGEPSIRKALLEKSDDWNYEREMRLVLYDPCDKNEFPTIHCENAAKEIYLGVKCSDSDRRAMEKAIGDKNISLYQMSVDETTLTRLKKTLIG